MAPPHRSGERLGRDEGALYRGSRLAEALEWSKHTHLRPTDLEREFLAASVGRERRERGARRRRLQVVFGALALAHRRDRRRGIVAVDQRRDADQQRNIAVSRELALESEDAIEVDPSLALSLALSAVDASPTDQATAALREATLAFRQLGVLRADSLDANAAAYSPDGNRVVTGGTDGRARVWRVATHRQVGQLAAGHGALLAADYARDGQSIALGFADGTVLVTDPSLTKPRVIFQEKGQDVHSVAFSGDGGRIAAGLDDGTLRVLAADESEPAQRLSGHEGAVHGVDISADGSRVVSAGEDGSVRLWSVVDGATGQVLHSGEKPERDVSFSPDDRQILAVGDDGLIRLWHGEDETRMDGEGRELLTVAFSANGRRFAAGGRDGVTRVWSTGGGPPVAVLRGQRSRVYDVAFGPAGDRVLSAGDDGTVRIWDAGRAQSWTLPSVNFGIDFNRDGSLIASSSEDGTIRVWDTATGRLRMSLPGPDGYTAGKFSPASETLVIPNYEARSVRLWPISSKSSELLVRAPKGRGIYPARFDELGNRVVYGDEKGGVVVHDLTSSGTMSLRGVREAVYDARFSPDGEQVATIGERGDVRIWRIDRPSRPERVLKGHKGHVNALVYSRDGRLVTAGADRTIRVWPSGDDAPLVLRGHTDEVSTVVVTADGSKVLSASQDGTLRLWDSRTGAELAVLQTESELYDVALSRDGKLATLGKGEVVQVFHCEVCGSLEDVRALALSRAPRSLTAEERQRFLAGRD